MRRLLVLCLLLFLAGCGGGPERLVAFGHSYAAGDYPGEPAQTWPGLAADDLGLELDNRAVSGSESPAVLDAVEAYEPSDTDVVVIDAMINDVRRQGEAGVARWRANLTEMLEHLTEGEDPNRIVVLIDPPITGWDGFPPFDAGSDEALAAYKGPTLALGRRFDAEVIDVGIGWTPNLISSDLVHPTVAGYERIADAVEAALE